MIGGKMNEELSATGGEAFQVGSRERPDAAGVVLRGKAVGFTAYLEKYGESPVCFFGVHGEEGFSLAPAACSAPAVMEAHGLALCARSTARRRGLRGASGDRLRRPRTRAPAAHESLREAP